MKSVIRKGLIWSGISLVIMSGILIYAWFNVPRDVDLPVHWGISGEPDRFLPFAGAMWSLSAPALISVGIAVLFAVLPWIDPRKVNLEKSRKAYLFGWIGTLAIMTGVTALMTASMMATGEGLSTSFVSKIILAGVAIFLIGIGNFLPKTRSNWFVGIRTPWTLSSDFTWEKTHRAGGWLFVLSGLIALPFAVLGSGYWQLTILPLILATVAFLLGYSWWVWREAPDRTS